MARSFEQIVKQALADQGMTILRQQAMIEQLQEELAEIKNQSAPKQPAEAVNA